MGASRSLQYTALAGLIGMGLAIAGCDPPPAHAPHQDLEACSGARAGVPCELPIEGGEAPIVSRCTKQVDGSLVCDSPRLPAEGRTSGLSLGDEAR